MIITIINKYDYMIYNNYTYFIYTQNRQYEY